MEIKDIIEIIPDYLHAFLKQNKKISLIVFLACRASILFHIHVTLSHLVLIHCCFARLLILNICKIYFNMHMYNIEHHGLFRFRSRIFPLTS